MKTHGIMFHHFYDDAKHIKGQGAISEKELSEMLDYYQERYRVISAREYYEKAVKGCLEENEVCLTFDDGLLCQFDVAYKVLKNRGLTGFFFIYTSPLEGTLEKIEIYRHFRFSKFDDIDEFYEAFFAMSILEDKNLKCDIEKKLLNFNPKEYAKAFTFYTDNDRRFRYLRDNVLGPDKYNYVMDQMIDSYSYNMQDNADILWMKSEHIKVLFESGNVIGLHSHTHPTVLNRLPFNEQKKEYEHNKELLEGIINEKIESASYPCNSYNDDTIEIMHTLGVNVGFRANMENISGRLLISREDHANILKQM